MRNRILKNEMTKGLTSSSSDLHRAFAIDLAGVDQDTASRSSSTVPSPAAITISMQTALNPERVIYFKFEDTLNEEIMHLV